MYAEKKQLLHKRTNCITSSSDEGITLQLTSQSLTMHYKGNEESIHLEITEVGKYIIASPTYTRQAQTYHKSF